MKKFIGGMIFGALIYPALSYCTSVIEAAANLAVTKLSVIIAKDAKELEEDTGSITHAIGFAAPDESYEEDDE